MWQVSKNANLWKSLKTCFAYLKIPYKLIYCRSKLIKVSLSKHDLSPNVCCNPTHTVLFSCELVFFFYVYRLLYLTLSPFPSQIYLFIALTDFFLFFIYKTIRLAYFNSIVTFLAFPCHMTSFTYFAFFFFFFTTDSIL